VSPAEARIERASKVFLVVLAIVACFAWFFGYVRPRDEYVHAVAACARNESRAEYARCSVIVRNRLTAQKE
jgi:hypothetical protein